MTDLEIMQHAKEYLDKLARGIDPLTGREVPEGEIINNGHMRRMLGCVWLSRLDRMSRRCPPHSNARVLKSAHGWKSWGLDGKKSK